MYIYLYTAEKKLLVHIWETHVETLADKEPGKSSFGGLRDQGRDRHLEIFFLETNRESLE